MQAFADLFYPATSFVLNIFNIFLRFQHSNPFFQYIPFQQTVFKSALKFANTTRSFFQLKVMVLQTR